MAQCAELNLLNIAIKKNIKVRNFSSGGLPSSVTFEHNGTEPFFSVGVYPKGRNARNGDYVSVMVNSCWFYPHLIPGVVYGSLGWAASIVDVEGRERFHAYFGNDDFLSLAWGEDFFHDHEFGLEMLVKRSVLLDDPEEFLPDDVLTVCCEVFYDCHTGDAAMLTRGEEINRFLVKAFTAQLAGLSNPVGSSDSLTAGNPITDIPKKTGPPDEGQSEFVKVPVAIDESTTSIPVGGVLRPPVPYDAKCWRKSIRMMNESLDELEDAFELYAKLQMLKNVREQNPKLLYEDGALSGLTEKEKVDKDFRQDIEKAACIFKMLRESGANSGTKDEDQNGPEPSPESNIVWWDESDGVLKVTHQLVRVLALHKHLQMRFENCKRCYLMAAEKMKACRKGESTDLDTLEENITEIFSLFNETRETFGSETDQDTEHDYLLLLVSRFLTVFLNTLRVLALNLYWPVCVLQAPPPEIELPGPDDTQREGNEIQPTSTNQDTQDKVSSIQKLNTNELPVSNSEAVSEDTDPILVAQTNKVNEKWTFTIETSDGKQLDIPFEEGHTTLGSLIRSASPVLDRMLDTPMLEKAQRSLKLDDTDYNTLCHFVSYIQTGEIGTETLDDSSLLYRMAHKYQVLHLVRACAERMRQLMSHLNVEDVGAFSQFYEDDLLMSLVEQYCFRPRTTIAAMGLQEVNLSSLFSESTWSQTIADVPILEKAIEAIVPKEDYDFYN